MKNSSSQHDMAVDLPLSAGAGQNVPVTVESMGSQGQGMARAVLQKVYIPFTLPGEIVRVALAGAKVETIAIDRLSPDRIAPVCQHFGACGGCVLQHWREQPYATWKTGLVMDALAREGLAAPIEALKIYPLASRRRATFSAIKQSGQVRLGFNAMRSHDIVDLSECPIVLPQISAALPKLRVALAASLSNGEEAQIHICAAENGLDVSIEARRCKRAMTTLPQAFSASAIIRATWRGEIVCLETAPFVRVGDVKVSLPQGAFLQAVEACERDMAAFAVEALAEAKATKGPICDLFAGLGAFTFPAAKKAPVTAFEGSADAVAALNSAAKTANGLKPVRAIRRDLFRNPVGAFELNDFSAAIADPPREGAEAQSQTLAASKIGTVVMLSCNPVTFVRDAAILVGGGFSLTRLAIFDQFKFSPHVEIAAAFQRARSKKGRLAPALTQR